MGNQTKNPLEESLEDLRSRKERAILSGGQEKINHIHEQGGLTARERIEKLVDLDSFLEVGMLNTSEFAGAERQSASDGIINFR